MEYINLITNIFTCIGIIVALLEFFYFRKSILAENERVRKQATIDCYKEICNDLYEINAIIYKKYKRNEILYEEINKDEKIKKVIKRYLNIMEWISTGINTGVYDLDVFDRLYGDVTIRMYSQLCDYITKRRKETGEIEIYQDYELMVKKLKEVHLKNKKQLLNKNAEIKNKLG